MARSRQLTVELYDEDDREISVEVSFSKGCGDYWSKSDGCYLPGDPDEIEIEGAMWTDGNKPLTDEEFKKYVDQAKVDEKVYDLLSNENSY